MKMDLSICRRCPSFETEMVNETYPRFLYCKKNEDKKKNRLLYDTNPPIGYGTTLFTFSTIPNDCDYKLEYILLQDKQ